MLLTVLAPAVIIILSPDTEQRSPKMCAYLFLIRDGLHLLTQSCLTLCDPMDCSLPGSSIHGDSSGKNTRVGCHALHQGTFLTRGSNPGLLHCRRILYHLSHQASLVNQNISPAPLGVSPKQHDSPRTEGGWQAHPSSRDCLWVPPTYWSRLKKFS